MRRFCFMTAEGATHRGPGLGARIPTGNRLNILPACLGEAAAHVDLVLVGSQGEYFSGDSASQSVPLFLIRIPARNAGGVDVPGVVEKPCDVYICTFDQNGKDSALITVAVS